MDQSSPQKPPQVKVVQFAEEDLKAFESICDAALKANGVKMAWVVACFISKFNSAPLVDSPTPTPPETNG